MMPGPDKIIACPTCGRLARVFTLWSGNTLSAVYWTDGKMEAPMLPKPPAITRCSECEAFFWTHEAHAVGEISPFASETLRETPKAWREARHVRSLRADELYEAIESGLAKNEEQERNLRVLAWWASNDATVGCEPIPEGAPLWMVGGFRHRNGLQGLPSPPGDAFTSNLEALYELLSEDGLGQRLMKAEVARELGRFDEAIQLLADDFPKQYQPAVKRIRELAESGERLVSMIPPPAPRDARLGRTFLRLN